MRQAVMSCAVLLAAVGGVSGRVAAQPCTPAWDRAIGQITWGGLTPPYADPLTPWNGRLYAGGTFTNINGVSGTAYIARWDRGTNTWTPLSFGLDSGPVNAFVTSILPADLGGGERLVVGGFFAGAFGAPSTRSLAVWDEGTQTWSGFPTGWTTAVADSVWSLARTDLGGGARLYVGGGFATIGGAATSGIAAWNGSAFESLAGGVAGAFSPTVFALRAHNDGSGPALFAAGRFDSAGGVPSPLIARWNGTSWSRPGVGLVSLSPAGGQISAMAVFNDGSGPALYVGGSSFGIAGSGASLSVARWDGTSWSAVGQNVGGRVQELVVWDDGSGPALYLAGSNMGSVRHVAKLVGNTWVSVDGGTNNSVFGATVWDNDLYLAGNFTSVGIDPALGFVRRTGCPAACYANCDGSTGSPLLTPADFVCFLNRFRAGDAYANCDGSTGNPALTPADFVCFLTRYRAGC